MGWHLQAAPGLQFNLSIAPVGVVNRHLIPLTSCEMATLASCLFLVWSWNCYVLFVVSTYFGMWEAAPPIYFKPKTLQQSHTLSTPQSKPVLTIRLYTTDFTQKMAGVPTHPQKIIIKAYPNGRCCAQKLTEMRMNAPSLKHP